MRYNDVSIDVFFVLGVFLCAFGHPIAGGVLIGVAIFCAIIEG